MVTGIGDSLLMGDLGEEQVWRRKELSVGLDECVGKGGYLWGKWHSSEIWWSQRLMGRRVLIL